MADTYADVAIGSKVTLRHWNTQGGYLHSHPHNYPTGSKRTCPCYTRFNMSVLTSFYRATDHPLPPQGPQQRLAPAQRDGRRRPLRGLQRTPTGVPRQRAPHQAPTHRN
jgi:hypothetical protein